jgi:hypothetical protein
MRQYGSIWGIAIPAAIFNSRFTQLIKERVTDPTVLSIFGSGNGYSRVSADMINTLPPSLANEIIGVISDSIRFLWLIALAFNGLSVILTVLEKEVPLRTTIESDHGIKDRKTTREKGEY